MNVDSLGAEFLRVCYIRTRRSFSMEAVSDPGLEGVRMSEPVRLGEILPAVIQEIAERRQRPRCRAESAPRQDVGLCIDTAGYNPPLATETAVEDGTAAYLARSESSRSLLRNSGSTVCPRLCALRTSCQASS